MSVLRTVANTERNVFFVNTVTITANTAGAGSSDFYNAAGVGIAIAPVTSADDLAAGKILVRDMGRTIRLNSTAGGLGIRLLRKVQRVHFSGLATNEGVGAGSSESPQYGVFYIELLNNNDAGVVTPVKWGRVVAPF
jgi:hypothetical protein